VIDCTRAAWLPQPPEYEKYDFQTQPIKVLEKFIENEIQISYVDSILMNWNDTIYSDHVRPVKFHAEGGYTKNNML